jgi:hypothetical protein
MSRRHATTLGITVAVRWSISAASGEAGACACTVDASAAHESAAAVRRTACDTGVSSDR